VLLACLIAAVLILLSQLGLAWLISAIGADLTSQLAGLLEQAKSEFNEVSYLRKQNTDLHDRLLAVLEAGAQARLASQRNPSKVVGISSQITVPLPRSHSPTQIDLPPLPPEPES
jgi:hypothetical protein